MWTTPFFRNAGHKTIVRARSYYRTGEMEVHIPEPIDGSQKNRLFLEYVSINIIIDSVQHGARSLRPNTVKALAGGGHKRCRVSYVFVAGPAQYHATACAARTSHSVAHKLMVLFNDPVSCLSHDLLVHYHCECVGT